MPSRDLETLEHSEVALSGSIYLFNLGLFLVSFITLYNGTPYTMINVSPKVYDCIWISSGMTCGFSFSALLLFQYAKYKFTLSPRQGKIYQGVGLLTLLVSLITFIVSFGGMVWGYSSTTELLHISNNAVKVIIFLVLLTPFVVTVILIIIDAIMTLLFCQPRYTRVLDVGFANDGFADD